MNVLKPPVDFEILATVMSQDALKASYCNYSLFSNPESFAPPKALPTLRSLRVVACICG